MQKLSHEYTISKEKSQDSNPDFASELGVRVALRLQICRHSAKGQARNKRRLSGRQTLREEKAFREHGNRPGPRVLSLETALSPHL